MITGAGGSIGSEISRQCIQFGVRKLNQDIEALIQTENKLGKPKEIVPEFDHKP